MNAIGEIQFLDIDTTTFDGPCYLERYPGVAADFDYGFNPALHYLRHGFWEGLIPGCDPPVNPGTPGTTPAPTIPAPAKSYKGLLVVGAAVALIFFKDDIKKAFSSKRK